MGVDYNSYRYYGRIIEVTDEEEFYNSYSKLINSEATVDEDNIYDFTQISEPILINDNIAIVMFGDFIANDVDFFIGYPMETKTINNEKKFVGEDIFKKVDLNINKILKELSHCISFNENVNKLQKLDTVD
jgi:hypothetical protein